MITAMRYPPNWVTRSARVFRLRERGGGSGAGLGGVLRLARVVAQVAIAEAAALRNVENAVDHTVDTKVCDSAAATTATAELGTGNDRDGAEVVCKA